MAAEADAISCQDMPINSLILEPGNGACLEKGSESVLLKGIAMPSGGRKIQRVEVSGDGENWHRAELQTSSSQWGRAWAWTQWTLSLPMSQMRCDRGKIAVSCRAVDESNSTQP